MTSSVCSITQDPYNKFPMGARFLYLPFMLYFIYIHAQKIHHIKICSFKEKILTENMFVI